ncbi:MAG: putative porin [Pseudohongiellaceae bacterium]|jgi:predicted porin
MKRIILPVALTSIALTLQSAQASSPVELYGKANLSINKIEQESKSPKIDEWQLNSNASRIGIKGSQALQTDSEDKFEAIYKMEFEVAIDDGDKKGQTFSQRNIYAGLKGKYGTLIGGKFDTPLKKAQGKVDRFGDLPLGDIKNIMEGEDRANNSIMYTTPTLNGFSGSFAAVPAEDSQSEGGDDGLLDGTSVSINYKNELVTAAIAHNGDIDGQDTMRLVADFNFSDSKLGFLVQTAENTEDSSVDEDSWLVSGQHKIGTYTLKAQYGMTDYSNNNEDTLVVVGVDKKMSKSSKIFTYYAAVRKDEISNIADDKALGFGYEIKF